MKLKLTDLFEFFDILYFFSEKFPSDSLFTLNSLYKFSISSSSFKMLYFETSFELLFSFFLKKVFFGTIFDCCYSLRNDFIFF